MIQKFDASSYNTRETVTLKLPITMPYGAEYSDDYERVDGEFEYNGEFYRLIKQKYAFDTLYVVCTKDVEHKRLHQAMNNYIKTFTDKTEKSTPHDLKISDFTKDYTISTFSILHLSFGWKRDIESNSVLTVFIPNFQCSITHPPELA